MSSPASCNRRPSRSKSRMRSASARRSASRFRARPSSYVCSCSDMQPPEEDSTVMKDATRPRRTVERLDLLKLTIEQRRGSRYHSTAQSVVWRTRGNASRGSRSRMDADLLRIPVGPGSMHVERYGHGGSPILLVHGFGTCAFLWREVGPTLASANRTAFAVDLFGYGESDRPFDAQFGIAAQSDYLDRALTALRLARAAVVGIDLGGAIAMRLAATRPERVEKLVLVNPIAFDDVPADDIKTMQRNTGLYALRVSRGILGAAPLLRELLERSVSKP